MEFNIEKMAKALAECRGGACFSGCYLFDTAIKDEQMRCMNCLNIANEVIKKLTEENERLKKHNEYILMQHAFQRRPSGDCWNDVIEKAKADTVREMQSEINKTLSALCKGDVSEIRRIIDQIAKEMLEGEK